MIKVTTDFETRSDVNLKKVGAYEYSMHPTTKPTCLGFKASNSKRVYLFNYFTINKRWEDLPKAFRNQWCEWIDDDEVVFSAHNAFFEQCIYENILVKKLGWPKIAINKWRCTAAKAAAAAIPRNLKDAGAVMRTRVQKDFEGHRVMLRTCKPTTAWVKWNNKVTKYCDRNGNDCEWDEVLGVCGDEPQKYIGPEDEPVTFGKLYHYCKFDVLSEEELDESLPDLTPFEQELWFVDQAINLRGIAVDMPLVNRISEIMAAEAKVMNKELDILTMGLVSSGNARAAILDFLTLEGIELPNLRAKTVEDFLENGKVTGDAKAVLQIRKALAKSSTAKYKTFQMRAASDGRVRDILLYCGAQRTGRWGGKGVQPQNFPRGVIKDIYEAIYRIKNESVEDLKLLYGENLMPLFSSVLRGMFIATPGFDMFVEDYSAIECRVAWWLAGHEAGLQMFRDGIDPYVMMAAKIFNKSPLDITDEERQVGKAAVLGCGYQMGGKKFVSSAWDIYRAKTTLSVAKLAVSVYREIHYPVTEMWEGCQTACIEATKNPGVKYRVGKLKFFRKGRFLYIQLPSGRCLSYCDPHILNEETIIYSKGDDTIYASTKAMVQDAIEKGYKKSGAFKSDKFCYWEVNQMARKVDCVIPKWSRERSYGGKIFENIVQAVSRDLLAEAIVRAFKKGFWPLMHSHDELVAEAPKKKFKLTTDAKGVVYCKEFRDYIEELPKWADGLPLKAGGWANDRYRKG